MCGSIVYRRSLDIGQWINLMLINFSENKRNTLHDDWQSFEVSRRGGAISLIHQKVLSCSCEKSVRHQDLMASIGEAIFKKTVGFLFNKARDKAAEKLKDGDVTDEKLRNLVVGKTEDIKTKICGLARQNLLASVANLESGTVCLCQMFKSSDTTGNGTAAPDDSQKKGCDTMDGPPQAASLITEGIIRNRELPIDQTCELLDDAKKRFEEARKKATEAFSNETLCTSDRILALKIQLVAAILERVDRPTDAVEESILCLSKLHAMPAVQKNFKVYFSGGVRSKANKEDREAIVVAVCEMNHLVFRIMQDINGGRDEIITLPCLKVEGESIDVLRDERVVKELLNLDKPELCIRFWSLGHQEVKEAEMVHCPRIVAAGARGQFLVAEKNFDRWVVKVYSPSGKFQFSLQPPVVNTKTNSVLAVAADRDDNVYVLARLHEKRTMSGGGLMHESTQREFFLYIFHQNARPEKPKPLSTTLDFKGSKMTINDNNQVFVAGELVCQGRVRGCHVKVFNTEGQLLRSFGEDTLKHPHDITSARDGRVLVLDDCTPPFVHTFSEKGDHLEQFAVESSSCENGSLAFDRNSEVIFVSLWGAEDATEDEKVSMYKDAKFVRHLAVLDNDGSPTGGVAVSKDGRLAVICDGRRVRVGEVKNL